MGAAVASAAAVGWAATAAAIWVVAAATWAWGAAVVGTPGAGGVPAAAALLLAQVEG